MATVGDAATAPADVIVVVPDVTAEIVVGLDDGTEVCSLVTEQVSLDLDIRNGMDVWVMFSAFSVILQAG